jgi:hypothetical protein
MPTKAGAHDAATASRGDSDWLIVISAAQFAERFV